MACMAVVGKLFVQIGILLAHILSIFCATQVPPTTITPTGTPSPVENNADLGPCTCDLTSAGCDVNCCCDPDCSADDRGAFKECTNRIAALSGQMCVSSTLVFRSNTQYTVSTTNPSLFCVVTDNYQARNFYTIPTVVNTSSALSSYRRRYGSYMNEMAQSSSFDFRAATHYKSGDPVYKLYSSEAIGMFGLSKPINSMTCNDDSPISYLFDEASECTRELGQPLAQTCQTNKALNADTYYKNFRVVPSPEIFKPAAYDINNPDSAFRIPLYLGQELIQVTADTPATCIDQNGLSNACPDTGFVATPSYDGSICRNAVAEVKYEITHQHTNGIKEVKVKFVLRDLKDSQLPFTQKFQVTWKEFNGNKTFVRSGNPGYVVNQPVLAGRLAQKEVNGVMKQSILLSEDRNQMLTMMASTTAGDCLSNSNQRIPVKFGVNMRSGCTVRVALTNMTNNCQLIQDSAKKILQGGPDLVDYVATFGNSDVEKVGDWVPIMIENEPPAATGSTTQAGLCYGMVLGMNLEIVYANVGSLANPQPKIIGVARVFDKPQDLRYECYGPYCEPNTGAQTQNFELTSSVTFIDASEKAVPFYAERPLLAVRLPYDFFYPFLSGADAPIQSHFNLLTTLLFGVLLLCYTVDS